MSMSTKAIYAERDRSFTGSRPRGIQMREVRPVAEASQGLLPLLDKLEQALKADAIEPAAVTAIGEELEQWAAANADHPAGPFAGAASAVALEAQDLDSAQHADLKAALGALSSLARAVTAAAPAPGKA